MKQWMKGCLAALLLTGAAVAAEGDVDSARLSKALGQQIGMDISRQLSMLKTSGEVVDQAIFQAALLKALSGQPGDMKPQELQQELMALTGRMRAAQQKKTAQSAQAGKDFLMANKAKPGVTTTASGLQYSVLKAGSGAMPKATDRVKVHYRGTLLDGNEFDSSYSRKRPATFGVNQVIKGWIEGLQLMKVGSKYKFFIPSDLAYGKRGSPPRIGPDQMLIFEVELLEILK